jgi:2',3'-cyclic-nucleotide 2'-phosphodiesterase
MKIIFIGDIVGRPGRETVKKVLPALRDKYTPDLIIANCENLSHGVGISEKTIEEMQRAGIQFFTSGNHIYRNKLSIPKLDDKKFPVIRPANFPPGNPGRGYDIIETGKMEKVLIINLMGRVFMSHDYDCPFRTVDKILKEHEHETFGAIFVDLHAEATSEKIAMAHYLDGRATVLVGTHTHVPTADAQIFPENLAYITDAGMVGSMDSIIGAEKSEIIRSFLTQQSFRYEIAEGGPMTFNAVYIETELNSPKAIKIEQIIETIND